MDLHREIEKLADSLQAHSNAESATIDRIELEQYLRRVLAQRTSNSELIRMKHQKRLDFWCEERTEMVRGQFAFAAAAIRSLILINGAAAVAILTFLGGLIQVEPSFVVVAARALLFFSVGVALATLVAMASYVVQFSYNDTLIPEKKLGLLLHFFAVILALLSLVSFLWGVYVCFEAMKSL